MAKYLPQRAEITEKSGDITAGYVPQRRQGARKDFNRITGSKGQEKQRKDFTAEDAEEFWCYENRVKAQGVGVR
jgi:hypothetical protein